MLRAAVARSFGKAVYIDKILPNTEAARLEREGKIKKGDQVRPRPHEHSASPTLHVALARPSGLRRAIEWTPTE